MTVRLSLVPPRTVETAQGTLFLEGPRVNAALLGGEAYQRLVFAAAGDPEATGDRRELRDELGFSWGRLVRARAESDERDAVWFLPPRPILPEHLRAISASLLDALTAARAADQPCTLTALADFHQQFIRLHPFQAANQSLCMNLVGHLLSISHGAGMPHLILDHLALRLSPAAYRRVFRLAAQGYISAGPPVKRWRLLYERKQRFFDFVERASATSTIQQAAELAASEPENARLALIGATR